MSKKQISLRVPGTVVPARIGHHNAQVLLDMGALVWERKGESVKLNPRNPWTRGEVEMLLRSVAKAGFNRESRQHS